MPSRPAVFRPRHQRSRKQVDAQRGSARQRGYTSRWDKAAAAYKRAHPLCVGCEAVGGVEPTTVVDHVEPHKGDMVLFWDQDNWQSCCDWHHGVVKQRLEAMFAAGNIGAGDLRLDSAIARKLTQDLRA